MSEAFSKDGQIHVVKDEEKHSYVINGVAVPSVTTILNCLQKGGLSWWGMRVGIQGCVWLAQEGYLPPLTLANPSAAEKVEMLLKEHKRTVNHTLDKAGKRGSSVHKAAEDFAATGSIPSLSEYPDTEKGYVRAFCRYVIENEPVYGENSSEVIVGSEGYGYAGTFDQEVTHTKGRFKGLFALADFKTSKKVYPDSHFPQLEAYEAGRVEMGREPTDARLLIRLGEDGEYEIARSCATFDTFLGIKAAFDAITDLKAAVKEGKKK